MALHRRLVDYHAHSTESCDGRSSILEMCQRATSLGMVEIGFSEHVDFDPSDRGFGFFDYDRYASRIAIARRLFEKRLAIRKGVEIDYQNRFEGKIKDWLQGKQLDFVIGAVHYVEGRFIDDNLVANSDLESLYSSYFDEVAKSVESCLFDVVGHLDCVSIYCSNLNPRRVSVEYWEGMHKALEAVIGKGMYLEMNSKLFAPARARALFALNRKRPRMIPHREVIAEYIKKGGNLISVGSDAHSTNELYCGIAEALRFLDRYDEEQIKLLFE